MTRPVYIAAMNARTCVGLTAEATAGAVRAGVSRVMEHPFFIDASGQPLYCGRDPQLEPDMLGPERLRQLARRTLAPLMARLSTAWTLPARVLVRLALPEPRPGFTTEDATQLGRALSVQGDASVHCIADGHAGALRALKEAMDDISQGRAEISIAGGVDSYLHADTLAWLDDERRLFRSGTRNGFSPGEGAAMLTLASAPALRQLQLRPLARVRSISITREARSLDSEVGSLGEGLSQAVAEATRDIPGDLVSDLYADINGETHRTEDWGFTALRCAPVLRDATDYVTTVGHIGELGAATAALGCTLAVHAWQRAYAKGPRALVWAGSWNGLRGAALLEQAEA